MVGSALGDAIGEIAFSGMDETGIRSSVERMDRLIYTDDTAMAIGLAESILQVGALNQEHLGETFATNFRMEPWRGYASGPPSVFALVQSQGISYEDAARHLFGGQGSFGNGAAMRIAPVGLFFYEDRDLYEKASASALVTHAHPVGVDGAAVLAEAVAQAVKLSPQEPFPSAAFTRHLMDFARTPEVREKILLAGELIEGGAPPPEAAAKLGRSVAVHESMPFALYSFLLHPDSYEDCLFCSILNGGDRDTLGAMACAVSGAYLGVGAIPQNWRARLENRDRIERLAERLFETRGGG
jgi:poly(ADP-ribose) glycohydrolase ARH3